MQKNDGISFLRGIAAFGIVGCHLLLMSRTEAGWAVTSLCDMNMGLFAAVSGYLMALGGWKGWTAYAKKRASRILPVYVVWTIVYLVVSVAFQLVDGGAGKACYSDLRRWYYVIFWGAAATHLWFFVSLFYAQIAMAWIFRKVAGCWWIVASLIVISLSIWYKNWYVTYPIRLLAFLMLGRGLAALDRDWLQRHRIEIALVAGLGVVIHFVHLPCLVGFVKDWIAVGPILLMFVACSDWFVTGRLAVVASFFGATSMGVYLLHPIFTKGVGIVVRWIFAAPYGVVPVMADWGVSWLCALAVTLLLLRFSKLARFVR